MHNLLQKDPDPKQKEISNFQDTIPHLGEKPNFKMAQGGNIGGPRGSGFKSTRKIFIEGLITTKYTNMGLKDSSVLFMKENSKYSEGPA